MIITKEVGEKIKIKRAKNNLSKTSVAKKLGIARSTLLKIENGNYNAPKRIFQSVMNWLIEDLWVIVITKKPKQSANSLGFEHKLKQ